MRRSSPATDARGALLSLVGVVATASIIAPPIVISPASAVATVGVLAVGAHLAEGPAASRYPQAAATSDVISSITTLAQFNAVACPTVQVCVAVGTRETERHNASGALVGGSYAPIVVGSQDGGQSWAPQHPPSVAADVLSVSCTSATNCVAVGGTESLSNGAWTSVSGVVLRTTDGSHWQHVAVTGGTLALDSVSCPSTSTCVAVGGTNAAGSITLRPEVLVSHDAGATWSAPKLPISQGELQGLSCLGGSRCVAVGVVTLTSGGRFQSRPLALTTANGGGSWTAGTIANSAGSSGGPDAVACATPTRCTSVGDTFDWCQCGTGVPGHYAETWTSGNGGRTWAHHVFPTIGGYDLWYASAISCWSATQCDVAATGTTTKPGSEYYPFVVPVSSVSGGLAAGDKGVTHGLKPQFVYGLACRSASVCIGVGENFHNQAAIEASSSPGAWVTRYSAS